METNSKYYEPRLLPGEKHQPSIRISAGKLLGLYLRAEMMMTAVDRRRYCDRAIRAIMDIIADFQLAYDFEDERGKYLRKMWADIAVYLELARIIGERNCIRNICQHEPMTPDQMKLEIFNETARLDEGASRWKNTVTRNKGKTPAAGRKEQSPEE